MGNWKTKGRTPALVAGVLAVALVGSTAIAGPREDSGSARGGAGFASGALIGGAAAGPAGMVVGAGVGAIMGERSHRKNETLAAQRRNAAELSAEVTTLHASLDSLEGRAGQVGTTVQFRTNESALREGDQARVARLGALLAGLPEARVRVSGFADARGDEAFNLALSRARAESVARALVDSGLPRERLIVEAQGERFASEASTADDQAFERSVEIRFETPRTALAHH